ncbi:MAG: hypothetical protein ACOYW3_10330 [Bacteroidota bacterium]
MRRLKGLTDDLLTSIDVLNTLNGGVVEPQMRLSEHEEYRQIELVVPGVADDNVKAEIHNNHLTIYYNLPVQTIERTIRLPRVVYNKQIPYFVDTRKIAASFEEGRFVVRLPFNEFSNGYHRDITSSN